MSQQGGWIGVDLDGTLAHYDGWKGPEHIGEPIRPMVERVKRWDAEGHTVKIFTARVFPLGTGIHVDPPRLKEARAALEAIELWCTRIFGHPLPVTCIKDYAMIELWDDRCVQVIPNTGERVGEGDPRWQTTR